MKVLNPKHQIGEQIRLAKELRQLQAFEKENQIFPGSWQNAFKLKLNVIVGPSQISRFLGVTHFGSESKKLFSLNLLDLLAQYCGYLGFDQFVNPPSKRNELIQIRNSFFESFRDCIWGKDLEQTSDIYELISFPANRDKYKLDITDHESLKKLDEVFPDQAYDEITGNRNGRAKRFKYWAFIKINYHSVNEIIEFILKKRDSYYFIVCSKFKPRRNSSSFLLLDEQRTNIDLSGKNLSVLPHWIFEEEKIECLDLSNNNLQHLDDKILVFKNLTTLFLDNNRFDSIPEVIYGFENLEILDLSQNPIESLNFKSGKNLKLKHLTLNNCKLKELPSDIARLSELVVLGLRGNFFSQLPIGIVELELLKKLDLNDNSQLTIPSEILSQGIKTIFQYLATSSNRSLEKINEAKLIIVGEGNVGKTYLKDKLIYNDIDPETISTEGIKIDQWVFNSDGDQYSINFWDFGGQEIYHSTHQFFLSKRTLYLFVWNARTDDNTNIFQYWLNVIRLLGNDAPVIIVQSKIDERIKNIDKLTLSSKFPNILSFHDVSSLTGEGIDTLREEIKSAILRLDHIGDKLPRVWKDLKGHVSTLRRNTFPFQEYQSMAGEYGLSNEELIILGRYYHDLGVFLHFEENPVLSQIVFLNPEWATRAVYAALDTKEIIKNKGRFNFDLLSKIWSDYPADKYLYLLELMKKFELIFNIPDTHSFILPELLPSEKPDNLLVESNMNPLRFEYHYDFLPKGIMSRLIVRLHKFIDKDIFWKNGVLIKYEGSKSLIELDEFTRILSIQVIGTFKTETLDIVRYEIETIHRTLNHPSTTQKIPCICDLCVAEDSAYMFNYDEVKTAKSKEKDTIECRKSFFGVSIEMLMGNVNSSKGVSLEEIYNAILDLKEAGDTREELKNKLNSIFQLKPNFMGFGVDLNYALDKFFKKD